ncbi:MAG: RNA-directed DNA polymerase [Candidatus Rifleibacteriota bacterium]
MNFQKLEPKTDLLTQEWLLVQAWKKTAAYIRSHNWYADILALDLAAIDLPGFFQELKIRLSNHENWQPRPIRMVPAPKSQKWKIEGKVWRPEDNSTVEKKIRPLAHIDLQDQVAATAISLCIADQVETLMGDPTKAFMNNKSWEINRCIAYGNRLFCNEIADNGVLQHTWGSSKYYRGYFQDYRSFLNRPEFVADQYSSSGKKIVIVQSDLKQFYDRVRPKLFASSLKKLAIKDKTFLELAKKVFKWSWHENDIELLKAYEKSSGINDFSQVIIPQGLVASGFFSNLVLLDFDQSLRDLLGKDFVQGLNLIDACRYVDDLRLVFSVGSENTSEIKVLKQAVSDKIQKLLDKHAQGLLINREKTEAAFVGGNERPIIRQSRKMERIQKSISGGFDAILGEEILDSIDGLIRSQARIPVPQDKDSYLQLSPIADVGDETVARFAAGRYRKTVRSLRPLLEAAERIEKSEGKETEFYRQKSRTKEELDEDTKCFAFSLVERWIADPSNIRLLRIGLDLWPCPELVEKVLAIIKEIIFSQSRNNSEKNVAFYCLAEILRAGATETGFIENQESTPESIDVEEYRNCLAREAIAILKKSNAELPWYLTQQTLLFLAVNCSKAERRVLFSILEEAALQNEENEKYCELLRFQFKTPGSIGIEQYAIYSIYLRRSIGNYSKAIATINDTLDAKRAKAIISLDPEFGRELVENNGLLRNTLPKELLIELGFDEPNPPSGYISMTNWLKKPGEDPNKEPNLLNLALNLLNEWPSFKKGQALSPAGVFFAKSELKKKNPFHKLVTIPAKPGCGTRIYSVPNWCKPREKWRFRLGYLLRFVLTRQIDFSMPVRKSSWKENETVYRAPTSHWLQRHYGSFSGHSAFGDEWLAITEWFESFMFSLLAWPGCTLNVNNEIQQAVSAGKSSTIELLKERIKALKKMRGSATKLHFLPIDMQWPHKAVNNRPFRACIIQTILPKIEDLIESPLLENAEIRRKQKNHLAEALGAVDQMVALRRSHTAETFNLDLLILPELSVHPDDVDNFLVPFARSRKTIILAGLTYDEIKKDQGYVNSAIWVIPVWSQKLGLQILKRRQGKQNPANIEENNLNGKFLSHRPCQWVTNYHWTDLKTKPIRLTASICYDSTDLSLVSDLKDKSDVFIVPAFNQDVNTFDHMALALHYHMFQMVVVANNGHFGGSCAHQPKADNFHRQIFHLHGNNQATLSFLEIKNIPEFLCRLTPQTQTIETTKQIWKHPPAGIK